MQAKRRLCSVPMQRTSCCSDDTVFLSVSWSYVFLRSRVVRVFFRFSREQGDKSAPPCLARRSFVMRSIINTIATVTRNVVAANRPAVSAVAGMGTLRVADSRPRHLYAGTAGIKRDKSGHERLDLWFAWLPCQLFRDLCPAVDPSSQRPGTSSRSRRPQGFRSRLCG